jgi:hypothetical protein
VTSLVLSRYYGINVPLIPAYRALLCRLKWRRERDLQDGTSDARPSIFSSISRTFTGTLGPIHQFTSTFLPRSSTYHPDSSTHGNSHLPAFAAQGQHSPSHAKPPPFVRKIKVLMYNYGSPKVGNGNFANFYDKMVPASYRVVVDGDIVPALPPQSNYSHVGTEILIDSMGAGERFISFYVAYCILEHISIFFFFNGLFSASILFHAVLTQRCVAGSIIIDPSFVERWLRTHMKSSVAVHSLLVYRKGLLGIKLAAEFMRANASTVTGVDPLRLALKVRTHHQVRSVLLIMSLYYSIVHGQ